MGIDHYQDPFTHFARRLRDLTHFLSSQNDVMVRPLFHLYGRPAIFVSRFLLPGPPFEA